MGKSDVNAWLAAHGPFAAGIQLLERYSEEIPEALALVLEVGETNYSRRELEAALRALSIEAIADQQQSDAQEREVIHETVITHELVLRSPRNDGIDRDKLTPQLVELHDQIKRNYGEMSTLHAQLELLPTDAARYNHALRIDTLDVFNVEGYMRLDAFMASGNDPHETPPPTREELRKELLRHRSYVCKKENQEDRPEEVARRRQRIVELEAILNAPV